MSSTRTPRLVRRQLEWTDWLLLLYAIGYSVVLGHRLWCRFFVRPDETPSEGVGSWVADWFR